MFSIVLRSFIAFITSFLIVFLLTPNFISYLKQKQSCGQPIREDGPKSHLVTKSGTPTMGGILIIISVIASSFIYGDLSNKYLWLCIVVMLGFGAIGLFDDYKKVSKHDYHGISVKTKFLLQIVISICCCWLSISSHNLDTALHFPIFKNLVIDLGWLFIPWAVFVIIGSSNAVNITDGLDGLATTSIITTSICLAIVCFFVGGLDTVNCFSMPHIAKITEICIFLSALIGACLGFLWYNSYPAKIFMGDTGSVAIGAVLGFIAVIAKQELLYAIIAGVFVIETLSDVLQIGYYKMTHKRIFKMAPLHHHLEHLGWAETTIVFRFLIISIIFGFLGLTLLMC